MDDVLNAFCHFKDVRAGGGAGLLAGLRFAVKDIFDIAGHVTGGGNPDWYASHESSATTAPVVQALLDAGAELVGVTHSTELTRGIVGDNVHYGTPKNPRAPGRVPGGSSSGSAAAVAGGLVDFALGSDTNGSIRVPASFCGVFGIKTSHGRIPLDGVFKHAPSYDTVGWFSRDANVLTRVGHVLLSTSQSCDSPRRILLADDAFAVADTSVRDALLAAATVFERLDLEVERARLCPVDLESLCDARYVLHGREAWQQFQPWFEEKNPRVSFDVARKTIKGGEYTEDDEAAARQFLEPVCESMERSLTGGTYICLPTTASVAWPAGVPMTEIAESIYRTSLLSTIGSALGAPQVSIPITEQHGLPIGLSLLGPKGSDRVLLEQAQAIERTLT